MRKQGYYRRGQKIPYAKQAEFYNTPGMFDGSQKPESRVRLGALKIQASAQAMEDLKKTNRMSDVHYQQQKAIMMAEQKKREDRARREEESRQFMS